jgi:hypothetical protein
MRGRAAPKEKTSVAISKEARKLLALMAEKSGISQSAEELRLEIERLREGGTTPRGESELSPEEREARRERFLRLAEQIRGGVPDEWTLEEIERRVEQVVTMVREERRACRR